MVGRSCDQVLERAYCGQSQYTSHLLWLKYFTFLTFMLLLWRSWAQDLKCLAFNSQSYFHRHLNGRESLGTRVNRESLGIRQERKTWTELEDHSKSFRQNLSVFRLRSKHRNTNLIWYEHQLYSRGLRAFFCLVLPTLPSSLLNQ